MPMLRMVAVIADVARRCFWSGIGTPVRHTTCGWFSEIARRASPLPPTRAAPQDFGDLHQSMCTLGRRSDGGGDSLSSGGWAGCIRRSTSFSEAAMAMFTGAGDIATMCWTTFDSLADLGFLPSLAPSCSRRASFADRCALTWISYAASVRG